MVTNTKLKSFLTKPMDASPLAFFRIVFGAAMAFSLGRFFYMGWIKQFYLDPKFHFTFYGFSWVQPLGDWTYVLFAFCFFCCLFMLLGYLYRVAAVGFFLSFTYLELIEKSTYLNHYYFVSLLAFLLIFLPANAYFSVDAYQKPSIRSSKVPRWSILSIQIMLSFLYFYAGLAKLNSDWLLHAQPLKTWLSNQTNFPIIGQFMGQNWFHFLFSWMGAAFDLSIAFLLFYRKTTIFAYVLVVGFHLMTAALFPIGMFPYIMIGCTLIFFEPSFHQKIIKGISKAFSLKRIEYPIKKYANRAMLTFLSVFFLVQLLLPFRYIFYPGELFWHEEGFRFSWRVMLMEKAGYTQFTIIDQSNGRKLIIDNAEHLTPYQISQMNTRTDFILQYAHYIADFYQKKYDLQQPAVFVDCEVSLNGRERQKFIDEKVNLLEYKDDFSVKPFIIPLKDKIYGL